MTLCKHVEMFGNSNSNAFFLGGGLTRPFLVRLQYR